MGPEGRSRGTTRCDLRTSLLPTLNTTPPEETQSPMEKQWLLRTPIGGVTRIGARGHLLSQRVGQELRRGRRKGTLSQTAVKELCKWVTWKAEACKMPSWWRELMAVPEVEDREKLVQEIQASFWLPKRASKLHKMENYHQASPALPCLLRRNFLPPPNSIFACWDIWEMQWEKMVAYAQALQYWAEKTDPPAGGRPCLLAESVKEL